jgi:iron complex outermembrane recepter protein
MIQPVTGSALRRTQLLNRGASRGACLLLLGALLHPGQARAETPVTSALQAAEPAGELPGSALQAPSEAAGSDYLTLGLEDLMNTTVTSVSRRSQRVSEAAAAVFVISQDDIRRSGVTSIAEALRMAPGIEVARIDANKWAISSRGLNGRFANKLLVLFDGRSVYTPLWSGVFWDRQDTVLEDIERIEVIRGPGAALWGANAVNGVINIITKSSGDTLGTLMSAGGGTHERGFGSARYGRQLGEDASVRIYGKYTSRAGLDDTSGQDGNNGWTALRGGFRLDAEPSTQNSLTLQGDLYKERLHETYVDIVPTLGSFNYTTPVFGANLLSRWKHTFSDTADLALQLYYDRTDTTLAVVDEQRDTFDVDFQNRFALTADQEIVWGGGYRYSGDTILNPSSSLNLSPVHQDTHLFSSFVQDNITLLPETLHFILGSKFEVNSYTGLEVQPNARLIFTPNRQHTLWGAVSRAVRTPSRGEQSLSLYLPAGSFQGLPLRGHLIGNDQLKAENLIAYELGYRVETTRGLTADLAAFYNVYRNFSIFRQGQAGFEAAPDGPHFAQPLTLGNFGRAETCGVELAADYKALSWWRLRGTYTWMRVLKTETDPGASFTNIQGESPQHQVSLRSSMDLSRNIELDLWLRYVGALEFRDSPESASTPINRYLTLDTRVAWKPWKSLELALVGQNLLQKAHREYHPQLITTQPTSVGRGMYGKLTWQF